MLNRGMENQNTATEGLLDLRSGHALRLERLQWQFGCVVLSERQEYEVKYLATFDESSRAENGVALLYLGYGVVRLNEGGFAAEAPVYLIPARYTPKGVAVYFDGAVANPALFSALRERYGVDMEPPAAADREAVAEGVEAVAAKARPGWAVSDECWLTLCDLSDYFIGAEEKKRFLQIKTHPVAGAIDTGKLPYLPEAVYAQAGDLSNLLAVSCMDDRQFAAAVYAAKGGSLLLEGAGGRTTAAVNIIANALYKGQNVLVVCNSPARRKRYATLLTQKGAGGFWLDVSSRRSEGELIPFAQDSGETYLRTARRAAEERRYIDDIDNAIKAVRSSGVRFCDAIEGFIALEKGPDTVEFTPSAASALRHDTYMHWRNLCEELVRTGAAAGHPGNSPYKEIRQKLFSKKLADTLPNLLHNAAVLAEEAAQYGSRLSAQWSLPRPVEREQYEMLCAMAGAAAKWEGLPHVWLSCEDMPSFLAKVRELVSRGKKVSDTRARLLCTFAEPALALDAATMLSQWTEAEQRLMTRTTVQGRIVKELNSMLRHGVKLDKKQVPGLLNSIIAYQKDQAVIQQILPELGGLLSSFWKDVYTDWIKVESYCRLAQSIDDQLTAALGSREACAALYARCAQSGDVRLAKMYENAWRKLEEARNAVNNALDVDESGLDPGLPYAQSLQEMYSRFLQNGDGIVHWCKWRLVREQAVDAGLEPVVAAYEGGLGHDQVLPAFERAIYLALTRHIVETDHRLGAFDEQGIEDAIGRLRELEKELEQTGVQALSQALAPNLPKEGEPPAYSEQWLYKRALAEPLPRWFHMLSSIPGMMPRRYPCILATLEDAARLPDKLNFELVIVDGAEAIPARRARAVISRGKTAVLISRALPAEESCAQVLEKAGLPVVELTADYRAAATIPGPDDLIKEGSAAPASAIGLEIASRLGRMGYRCRFEAGCCDLAVFAPDGRPVAGVLLDTVHLKEMSLCDRELCRARPMEEKGVPILRVWSAAWWQDPDKAFAALLQRMDAVQQKETTLPAPPEPERKAEGQEEPEFKSRPPQETGQNETISSVVQEEGIAPKPLHEPPQERTSTYRQAELIAEESAVSLMEPEADVLLKSKIAQVIEAESPVAATVIAKKVLIACGAKRAGSKLQKRIVQLCDSMELPCTVEGKERFYWKAGSEPDQYSSYRIGVREAAAIPCQESANAVQEALAGGETLSSTELARRAAYLMGYSRMGAAVEEAMYRGIEEACRRGAVARKDDYYSLKEQEWTK